jgi:exosortase
MTSNENQPNRRALYWTIGLAALAIIMYSYTFRYLYGKWMDDAQYSLGFLVPVVSGYFVWKKWPEARLLKRDSSNWGLLLIVVALMLHLAGTLLDVSGPSGVSIILALIGGCLYLHSKNLVYLMAFPLAYTVFMIPLPGGIVDRLGLPMQILASRSTASILGLILPDVSRTGIQLTVDGYDFVVAPACSGLSSLVALVGVTAVFAYITRLSAPLKWLLFAFSLPIALVANIIRITSIGLLGYYWDWDKAMGLYHDFSSPFLFLIAIGFLFAISGGLEWLSARRTTH